MPTLGLFAFKVIRGLWLYRARVPCNIRQSLGSFLAGLSLTHTVARGTLKGLFTSSQPFLRTPKNEKRGALFSGLMSIRQELLILLALAAAIIAMSSIAHFNNFIGHLWIIILSVQMVPYLATLLILLISIM
jgi:hypothetical protein